MARQYINYFTLNPRTGQPYIEIDNFLAPAGRQRLEAACQAKKMEITKTGIAFERLESDAVLFSI